MKIANLVAVSGNMRYNKREYKRKNHKLTCETRGQKDGKNNCRPGADGFWAGYE